MIMGIVAVGVVAKIVLGAVQSAVRRRETEAGRPDRHDPDILCMILDMFPVPV